MAVQDRQATLPGSNYIQATYRNMYTLPSCGPRNSNFGVRGCSAFVIDDERRASVYLASGAFYAWLSFSS